MKQRTLVNTLKGIFSDGGGELRHKVIGIYAILIILNLAVWLWAVTAFHAHPVLLGTALMAYSFGLRHAVDADHIAAIDNATRKLMQTGKRPVSIGLMFSLGHSSIVIAMTAAIAATELALKDHFAAFKSFGAFAGTLTSSLFLLAIALMNLVSLIGIVAAFRRLRAGEDYREDDFDMLLGKGGLLARLFRPMFALITRSWHMYPLGLLFGLGFDTATEIGLMGISASSAAQGMPVWDIMLFPLLFTAGMTLIDTTDSIMMLGAYGWAFIKPVRKIYYNITITSLSIVMALVVGGIEGLGLIGDRLELKGAFWDVIGTLNAHFGAIGYAIIALFVASWALSFLVYRWLRIDAMEVNG
ncbi:HoxN/HupN/NixA family nickel/cobalt transporter [Paludibacterium yongneupense]|uniref:HoxN/HupN/NixA family nickel/cobalt transporter n=1 Tax=Paludibacterium yongneupense TaxID=400061 RepID=UPI0004131707|nr:HoxN/HupN/NixA family nickel/cobalt transporter [Paludibacterium yongneupense]